MEGQHQTETVVETATESAVAAPAVKKSFCGPVKKYLLTALVILIIAAGLVFVLEREGRISTNLFSFLENSKPAAIVNGTEISRADFESSLNQLMQMAVAQGASSTDPALVEQNRQQAIETLINGELLRQAAIAAGKTAGADAINARYTEIETGLGGAEPLAAKMAEFGITEASLRRDIENEILIQSFFDEKFPLTGYEVTDADINEFYTKLGGEEAGLPPLKDVQAQVAEQIKLERRQTEVSELIDTLRAEATIENLL